MEIKFTGEPEPWQLFYGIHEGKLFLQIADRKGIIIHEFERPVPENIEVKKLLKEIDYLIPENFAFNTRFCIIRVDASPFPIIHRDGQKITEQEGGWTTDCKSLASFSPILSKILITCLPMDLDYGPERVYVMSDPSANFPKHYTSH